MEEQPLAPDAEPHTHVSNVGDAPSVTGAITDTGQAPVLPMPAQDAGAAQGDLRPVWPRAQGRRNAQRSRRYARLAKSAMTLCAILFFYVSWSPMANALTSGDLRIAPTGPEYRFSLTVAELGAPPLHAYLGATFFGWWSGLTVVGLLLCPLLWQTSVRWLRWIAVAVFAVWMAAMSYIFALTAQLLLMTIPAQLAMGNGPYKVTLYPYGIIVAVYSIAPGFGLWLAPLAVLVGIVAGVFAAMSLRLRLIARVPVTPIAQGEIVTSGDQRPTRSLPGAGAVSGGLVLWAWGYFLLPWATVNCNRTPLLVGTCRGLPVASALQIGLGVIRAYFDPSAALYALTGLLLVGALAILLAVWRREVTRTVCAWASVWLALALACGLLAINGAQQVVHDAAAVGMPAGDWRGDSGVLVVFLALLLVAIGLMPLWAVGVRSAQRREAQRRTALGA